MNYLLAYLWNFSSPPVFVCGFGHSTLRLLYSSSSSSSSPSPHRPLQIKACELLIICRFEILSVSFTSIFNNCFVFSWQKKMFRNFPKDKMSVFWLVLLDSVVNRSIRYGNQYRGKVENKITSLLPTNQPASPCTCAGDTCTCCCGLTVVFWSKVGRKNTASDFSQLFTCTKCGSWDA